MTFKIWLSQRYLGCCGSMYCEISWKRNAQSSIASHLRTSSALFSTVVQDISDVRRKTFSQGLAIVDHQPTIKQCLVFVDEIMAEFDKFQCLPARTQLLLALPIYWSNIVQERLHDMTQTENPPLLSSTFYGMFRTGQLTQKNSLTKHILLSKTFLIRSINLISQFQPCQPTWLKWTGA